MYRPGNAGSVSDCQRGVPAKRKRVHVIRSSFLCILSFLPASPVLSLTLFPSQTTWYYIHYKIKTHPQFFLFFVVFLNSDALFGKIINSTKLEENRGVNESPLADRRTLFTAWILHVGELVSNNLQLIFFLHSKRTNGVLEREVLLFIYILGL